MDYIFLFLGFVLLMFGGDFLVKGSVSLAGHFKVSKLVIGLVVVSFGTSAPELVVSLDAAIKGFPDIAVGNVVGSNIANIALVLGLTAIVLPIKVKKKAINFDWSVMMFISLLVFLFCFDLKLQFIEGVIFIIILFVFIYRSIYKSRKNNKTNLEESVPPKFNLFISILFVIAAGVGLIYGAEFLVKGASNIFNMLAVLGLTSIVKSIDINPMILKFDMLWMIGISLLLFLFILPLSRAIITRWKGFVFVAIYIIYIYLAFAL
jgi:cation:H+ antiporter